jgi:sugar lactone lactonase YvrE
MFIQCRSTAAARTLSVEQQSSSAATHLSPFRMRRSFAALLLIALSFFIAATTPVAAQVTFAGTQFPIVASGLSAPAGLASDGYKSIYIADRNNNRILKVTHSGATYGSPVTILSGLSNPMGVACDWYGNIYVADTGNNRIVVLRVSGTGYSSPAFISPGLSSPGGIAVDAADNIFVADSGNNRIVQLPNLGSTYGAAVVVGTGFSNPLGVAVDSVENLYIADTGNNRVIKEAYTSGTYPTQVAVGQSLRAPAAISVDNNKDLFISDTGNGRVVEEPWYSPYTRYNPQLVLGGDFTTTEGVTIDVSGNLYAADAATNRVESLVTSSVNFGSVNVGTPAFSLSYDFNVAAGTTIGSVGIYTQGVSGKDFTDAGSSTCTPQTYTTAVLCVVNVAFTPQDSGVRDGAIVLYNTAGNSLATAFISGTGVQSQASFIPGTMTELGTGLSGPQGVAVDGSGNVFISDTGNDRVVMIPSTANGYGQQTVVPLTGISEPVGVAVDAANSLYVVSSGNDKLVKLPWIGTGYGSQIKVGSGFYGPAYVTLDATGNVYVTDLMNSRLTKIPWTGSAYSALLTLGNWTRFPVGVAVNANGDILCSLPYSPALIWVRLINGAYIPQVGIYLKNINFPAGLVVDGNSNLYIVDTAGNQVIMLPWNGTGYGSFVQVAVGLNLPTGIAIDSQGNIYIADTGNNRIVKIDQSTPPPMTFATTTVGSVSSDGAKATLVENTGNVNLNISDITFPSNFPALSGDTYACTGSQTLAVGNFCRVSVTFNPQVAGSPLQNSVVLQGTLSNNSLTQQSIAVSGVAIGKTPQTIQFPTPTNTTYGATSVALSATTSSKLAITYQLISGPATLKNNILALTGIGTVVVQASQAGNATYQAAASVTVSFAVTPAVLTVKANSVTATYGSIPSSFNYSITGFVLNQSSQVVSGSAIVTSTGTSKSGVGSYTLKPSQGTLSAPNYTFVFVNGTLTVNPASLTLTPVSFSTAYGKPLPTLTWTMTGLVNGDTASVVMGKPVVTTEGITGSPSGSYPITLSVGTLASANYTFKFGIGTLSVVPSVLTVVANSQTITYGASVPNLTYIINGFLEGDTQNSATTGAPLITTTAVAGSAAGTYPINIALGTLKSKNYTFAFTASSLIVQKGTLTVTPKSVAMTYGQATPTPAYTVSGYLGKDTQATAFTGTPAFTTTAGPKVKPGSYPVTATAGSMVAHNYNVVFGSSTVTIAKAVLQVIPQAVSITYGSKAPSLTYSFTGFVNGDTTATVQGAPVLTTTAGPTAAAGIYAITATQGTLTSPDYTFSFSPAAYTIAKAAVTITANNQTITYGSTPAAATYTVTGLVKGDTAATAITGTPKLVTTVTSNSPVGSYPASIAAGALSAHNYTVVLKPGVITVAPAALTVVANDRTMKVGAAVPALTYTVNGLLSSDAINTASVGTPALTTTASKTAKSGVYPIAVAQGTMKAPNYKVTFVSGKLTVTQ